MMAVYQDDEAINPAVFSRTQAELVARRMIALRIHDAPARFRSFAVAGCAIPDFRDYLKFIDPKSPDRDKLKGGGALHFVERLYAQGDKANGDLAVSLTKEIEDTR